jgi:hypothetical protein
MPGRYQLIGRRSRTALDLDWGGHRPCWKRSAGDCLHSLAAHRRPAGLLGNGADQSRRSPWRVRRWSDDRGSVLRPASRGAGDIEPWQAGLWMLVGVAVLLLADQLVERRFGSQGAGGAMGIIVGSSSTASLNQRSLVSRSISAPRSVSALWSRCSSRMSPKQLHPRLTSRQADGARDGSASSGCSQSSPAAPPPPSVSWPPTYRGPCRATAWRSTRRRSDRRGVLRVGHAQLTWTPRRLSELLCRAGGVALTSPSALLRALVWEGRIEHSGEARRRTRPASLQPIQRRGPAACNPPLDPSRPVTAPISSCPADPERLKDQGRGEQAVEPHNRPEQPTIGRAGRARHHEE